TGIFPAPDHGFAPFDGWMQGYVDQIIYIRENGIIADEETQNKWNYFSTNNPLSLSTKRGTRSVDPLITATWAQTDPYNKMCPEDPDGPGGNTEVGCVSTAMSMIMHYWRYPLSGTGEHSYDLPTYGTIYANFGDAIYNWNGMTDVIDNRFIWEIAEISFHGGVSVNMQYGPDTSGIITSQNVPYSMSTYFNYSDTIQFLSKNDYTSNEWENILKGNLDAYKPLLYHGEAYDSSGHAFVCDGYQGSYFYHFNFGWSGNSNGYYTLESLNAYKYNQGAVINIYPGDSNYPYISEGDNELTSLAGSFTDGSGPAEDYPAGMQTSWLINPQNAQDSVTNITLSFIEFDTYGSDTVKVYDGGDDSAELIGEYSGSTVPTRLSGNNKNWDITSTGNQLYVTFSSAGEAPGFKIEYYSNLPRFCMTTNIYEPQGTLTDGSEGFWYSNSTVCIFVFSNPEAVKYHLDFTEFATEEGHDMVKVYNGETSSLIGEYSGYEIPDPIEIETSNVLVWWTTNEIYREAGWSLNYSVDGVSVEETAFENLNIFPNPTNGLLNINFYAEKQGVINVKLISISGQVIFNDILTSSNGSYKGLYDLNNQPKGVYLLSIISD
ncbi:MAG: T9SS type A sorting domain-containing protein, partial [Bacteroidetes bacterium]|nr:T9SS type A sorting domain-containing protein [Bacteroidota bacterium]